MKKEKKENEDSQVGEVQEEDATVGGNSCLTDKTLWKSYIAKYRTHGQSRIFV